MCRGIQTTYTQCQHFKLEVTDPCKSASSCGDYRINLTRDVFSYSPNICPNCYRRQVDGIRLFYNARVQIMDEEIEKCTLRAQAASSNEEAQKIKAARSELEVKRGDYVDGRTEALEHLRTSQGVWADGTGGYFPRGYNPWGYRDRYQVNPES
ncbi:MAG: hypothetical protein L6R37_005999 [Teloschistes peruensis]|nr:MAG: hypothetical protein L6R37_005999 [Teloschistes peruensis]